MIVWIAQDWCLPTEMWHQVKLIDMHRNFSALCDELRATRCCDNSCSPGPETGFCVILFRTTNLGMQLTVLINEIKVIAWSFTLHLLLLLRKYGNDQIREKIVDLLAMFVRCALNTQWFLTRREKARWACWSPVDVQWGTKKLVFKCQLTCKTSNELWQMVVVVHRLSHCNCKLS